MQLLIPILAFSLAVAGWPAVGTIVATQADPSWLIICSGKVRPVSKKLKFQRRNDSLQVKDSIQLCTKHVYEFSGKAGQRVGVRLTAGTRTWMILSPKKGDRVFSELREWEGVLPTDGKYTLTVVTAETATPYTLEIKFR